MILKTFFKSQLAAWPLAAENYNKLKAVEFKRFDYDGFYIRAVYNPARAVSSLAKLDPKSIKERPCFLCAHNRPPEQQGLDFKGHYQILINPYPICPVHFTVVENEHCPQEFTSRIDDFLDLSAAYPDYIALFNGAKAGASAPDHCHFQLVGRDFFSQPVEQPMPGVIVKETIKSSNANEIKQWFADIFAKKSEELCNMFAHYTDNQWIITVFPRIKHRPSYFFSGEILSSPGAIDMTGNLIIAREEDFKKLTKDVVTNIYREVSGI